MNRRQFISAATGAAIIPQLPKAFPESYSIFDLDVVGQPLYPYLESKGLDAFLEWQEYMTRVIAAAFDVSPYLLGE